MFPKALLAPINLLKGYRRVFARYVSPVGRCSVDPTNFDFAVLGKILSDSLHIGSHRSD
jgi:hypothetical protein